MGSRLVGLHLKSMLQRKSLTISGNWLVLAGVGLPGNSKAPDVRASGYRGTKDPKTG